MRFHISSERAAGDCVQSSFLWTLGVFLPGFVPRLGFLPHRVQKQVGTEAHPTQSERNWKKNIIHKCIYALFATYCNVLEQDKRGCWQDYSFDRVLLSTHLPRFSKLLWPENAGSAVGRLPWPGAVYRESHLNLQFSFCPKFYPQTRKYLPKRLTPGTCFKSRDFNSQNMWL